MAKRTYVIDTSVYLSDHRAITSFGIHDVVIPLKVLEEIDKHKKRQDSVGSNARAIIRTLDSLREKGNLHKGVRISKGKGLAKVTAGAPALLPRDLSSSHADHVIISTALSEKEKTPNRKVIMVTRDINMRVICDSIQLQCQDYNLAQFVDSADELYKGYTEVLVDEQIIDRFYESEEIMLDTEQQKDIHPNQLVMLISSSNEKKTALAQYISSSVPLRRIPKQDIWGVRARNKEQLFALNLLMDPNIPFVTLVGKAGSGKTLCAIAAGLNQTLEGGSGIKSNQSPTYKRLIVSRPVQPLGKDIGFLPGSLEEKMTPWLKPIQDNLQFLMGDDRSTLEMYMDKGSIEVEALTYIRGRSISNAFIIIDEAQNLTTHEIKTIITRVGENTKIVFTGDIEQIDNVYVDETTNGLTYAIEKFKQYSLAGHITLEKGERSQVASLAAKIL